MEFPHNSSKNLKRGFTLYYAVLISSVLLVIGATMLGTALKAFLLTSSIAESNKAFYAADSGIECAMYWDLKYIRTCTPPPGGPGCGFISYMFPHNTNDGSANIGEILCDGNTAVAASVITSSASGATVGFSYDSGGANCVSVSVKKVLNNDQSISTFISSRGYNMTCAAINPRKVERGFEVKY